jgi:hypothetical protein
MLGWLAAVWRAAIDSGRSTAFIAAMLVPSPLARLACLLACAPPMGYRGAMVETAARMGSPLP